VGAAIGMAVGGLKPVVEIQFSGFTYSAFNQLANHAPRTRSCSWSRPGFTVPLKRRIPFGAMRLFTDSPPVKLNPRNFRSLGHATTLFDSFTFSRSFRARKRFTPSSTLQGQLQLDFPSLLHAESLPVLAIPNVRAFGSTTLLCPLLTSGCRSATLTDRSFPIPGRLPDLLG